MDECARELRYAVRQPVLGLVGDLVPGHERHPGVDDKISLGVDAMADPAHPELPYGDDVGHLGDDSTPGRSRTSQSFGSLRKSSRQPAPRNSAPSAAQSTPTAMTTVVIATIARLRRTDIAPWA